MIDRTNSYPTFMKNDATWNNELRQIRSKIKVMLIKKILIHSCPRKLCKMVMQYRASIVTEFKTTVFTRFDSVWLFLFLKLKLPLCESIKDKTRFVRKIESHIKNCVRKILENKLNLMVKNKYRKLMKWYAIYWHFCQIANRINIRQDKGFGKTLTSRKFYLLIVAT